MGLKHKYGGGFETSSRKGHIGLANQKKNFKEGLSHSSKLARKYAYQNTILTIAEIYFATNKHEISTSDDIIALDSLILNINTLLKEGFKLDLFCIGGADCRGTSYDNDILGRERAESCKKYIEPRITQKGLTIYASSDGEGRAHQRIDGKLPSQKELMKDRKAVIVVNTKYYVPPVKIIVTEENYFKTVDDYFKRDIERLEIEKGGKVVGLELEMEDPFFPSVEIKIKVISRETNNHKTIHIDARAFYLLTNELLFLAYANTDQITEEQLITYGYTHPDSYISWLDKLINTLRGVPSYKTKTIVERQYHEPKEEYRNEGYIERIFVEKSLEAKKRLLSDMIYNQLRGSYNNITERVKTIMSL